MSLSITADISITTSNLFSAPLSLSDYDSIFVSSTTYTASPAGTGADDYPVFPNGLYLSKFYLVSSQDSGLTHLDIDLYNYCYLPYNPLPYIDNAKRSPQYNGEPRPDYLLEEAPCKRAAAINANCYIENTNGSFTGLRPSEEPDIQQKCYCDLYPYFDSTLGCMQCLRKHGGIEGYHWYPQPYVEAVSSSYCAVTSQRTRFYDFAREWARTDAAAMVPTTTAENELGSRTAASLYYTYAAAATGHSSENVGVRRSHLSFLSQFIMLATVLFALPFGHI